MIFFKSIYFDVDIALPVDCQCVALSLLSSEKVTPKYVVSMLFGEKKNFFEHTDVLLV